MTTRKLFLSISNLRERMLERALDNAKSYQNFSQTQLNVDPAKVFENGKFKSTAISLGKDPRTGTKPALSPPDIMSAEIKLDGIFNPYVTINFQMLRQDLEATQIILFKIYRQRVSAKSLDQEVQNFNASDFDKVSNKTTRSGKFSADRKAQYNIAIENQSQVNQNVNLFNLQETSISQNLSVATLNNHSTNPSFFADNSIPYDVSPQCLSQVNVNQYITQAQLRQVYVTDNKTVNISFDDHKVTYGGGYTYSVTSFTKTSEESSQSPSISMVVLNLDGIDKPISAQVKQVDEKTFQIAAAFNPKDNIKHVYIFKRDIEDIAFHPFGEYFTRNNSIVVSDTDLVYLTTYVYRIILENIFGALSEPVEITATCSIQNIIDKTRSHNLLIPILIASQDQNSDGVKITIFPNDSKILYYELKRRNLTIGEKKFLVPSNTGREFWPSNKFFVTSSARLGIINSGTVSQLLSGSLPPQSDFTTFADPIIFVDRYVTTDNYYQYRIAGYDVFGNSTSFAFASLTSTAKNSLRTPTNLSYEILRETPFRVKLVWEDDNQATLSGQANDAEKRYLEIALKAANLSDQQSAYLEQLLTDSNTADQTKVNALNSFNLKKEQVAALESQLKNLSLINDPNKYQLQRRRNGEVAYSSFPLTVNRFIIDEVATPDAISFSATPLSDSFGATSSSLSTITGSVSVRPFGFPDFLVNDQVYQYRISAVGLNGSVSDFSDPISFTAQAQISPPVNVTAKQLNFRVLPLVIVVEWALDPLKSHPDHWRIERKINVATETFQVIGNAFLINEYNDRNVQLGNQYTYRVRSVSATGTESDSAEVSINT